MTRKRTILITGIAAAIIVAGATSTLWWPRKVTFLETANGRYQVLSARYVHGTNLTFYAETPAKIWMLRNLDRFGIHLKGSRRGAGFNSTTGVHAIALFCKGDATKEDLTKIEAQCITESGQTVRLNHKMMHHGSGNHTVFIFHYADSEIPFLHQINFADSEVTNFCPTQISIFRASNHEKLSTLDVSH